VNLHIFLNETCKDAMNIKDFVESIHYKGRSLDELKNENHTISLSKMIVSNLNGLDITKRPIHCTDINNKTLFIKDDNLWAEDNERSKIKNAINTISKKQNLMDIQTINNTLYDNKSSNEYINLTKNLIDNNDINFDNKTIIDNITKHTSIDKKQIDIIMDIQQNNITIKNEDKVNELNIVLDISSGNC